MTEDGVPDLTPAAAEKAGWELATAAVGIVANAVTAAVATVSARATLRVVMRNMGLASRSTDEVGG
jgi:hypothetical protein